MPETDMPGTYMHGGGQLGKKKTNTIYPEIMQDLSPLEIPFISLVHKQNRQPEESKSDSQNYLL